MARDEEEQEYEEEQEQQKEHRRLCDFCGSSIAVLFCRADSAKLCFNCDREVHSTNPLFNKHSRSQLCDSCDSSPASIFCSTDNTVLCQNCDWGSHGRALASMHDRRPLEGFTGCPSASELGSFLGFEELGKKAVVEENELLYGVDGFLSDLLVWETPPIVSVDDLIVSSGSSHSFQALGIPPLPKNRNTTCGKYKEEMMHQLRNMLMAENTLNNDLVDVDALLGLEPLVPMPTFQPGCTDFDYYEASSVQCNGGCSEVPDEKWLEDHTEGRFLPPEKPNDAGVSGTNSNVPPEKQSQNSIIQDSMAVVPKVALRDLDNHNRDLSISRYKAKKKTRRYEKRVRYESRKARAECRTRFRGRFAKVEH